MLFDEKLENGEIIPVGSSTAQKINVRVVAATNIDLVAAVRNGRFREDLYYRLQQISIYIPPLRERIDDIPLLFRKFSSDVAEKYHMPPILLTDDARRIMMEYPWYGNIRELKNITEQIAVVETERNITPAILQNYLTVVPSERMPALIPESQPPIASTSITDRELLLKALSVGQMISEMRQEINELRQAVNKLGIVTGRQGVLEVQGVPGVQHVQDNNSNYDDVEIIEDEALALDEREKSAILRALDRNHGNRKLAAAELHISERTLYRKLKEYNIAQ